MFDNSFPWLTLKWPTLRAQVSCQDRTFTTYKLLIEIIADLHCITLISVCHSKEFVMLWRTFWRQQFGRLERWPPTMKRTTDCLLLCWNLPLVIYLRVNRQQWSSLKCETNCTTPGNKIEAAEMEVFDENMPGKDSHHRWNCELSLALLLFYDPKN